MFAPELFSSLKHPVWFTTILNCLKTNMFAILKNCFKAMPNNAVFTFKKRFRKIYCFMF